MTSFPGPRADPDGELCQHEGEFERADRVDEVQDDGGAEVDAGTDLTKLDFGRKLFGQFFYPSQFGQIFIQEQLTKDNLGLNS
jgi:hypothetical protein